MKQNVEGILSTYAGRITSLPHNFILVKTKNKTDLKVNAPFEMSVFIKGFESLNFIDPMIIPTNFRASNFHRKSPDKDVLIKNGAISTKTNYFQLQVRGFGICPSQKILYSKSNFLVQFRCHDLYSRSESIFFVSVSTQPWF